MCTHREKVPWGRGRTVAICKPRREEASGETRPADALALTPQAPGPRGNESVLLTPQSAAVR